MMPDAAGRALVERVAGGPLIDLVILRGADVLGRFGRVFAFLDTGRVAVRDGGRLMVADGGLFARVEGPAVSCGATACAFAAGRPTASSLALRLRAGAIRGIEEEARGSRDCRRMGSSDS
jgi:hypothetical protein